VTASLPFPVSTIVVEPAVAFTVTVSLPLPVFMVVVEAAVAVTVILSLPFVPEIVVMYSIPRALPAPASPH
jgi:hypothetical protein